MYKYLKAFFASFPSVQSTPSCPLSWIVTSVANDLILIEPDREKYFLLTQLIFCKRSVPKPNKVAHLRSPSEPSYYIPQRDGTPQQSSHDCVLDCVGTEKLKYYTEHLEWESKVEGTMVLLSVSVQFSSVQFSRVQMFETPWTAACQASLSMTNSQSLHKFMSIALVIPSNHLSSPSPPTFNLSQHQGLFKWVSSLHQVAKILEFQFQHQSFQWIFRTDFL